MVYQQFPHLQNCHFGSIPPYPNISMLDGQLTHPCYRKHRNSLWLYAVAIYWSPSFPEPARLTKDSMCWWFTSHMRICIVVIHRYWKHQPIGSAVLFDRNAFFPSGAGLKFHMLLVSTSFNVYVWDFLNPLGCHFWQIFFLCFFNDLQIWFFYGWENDLWFFYGFEYVFLMICLWMGKWLMIFLWFC